MKYRRRKREVVEARQFLGFDHPSTIGLMNWINSHLGTHPYRDHPRLAVLNRSAIYRLSGVMLYTLNCEEIAREGDWIYKDAHGEFHTCVGGRFEETFKPVED